MRTNIVLDEELIREASLLTGIKTKRELVEVALRELIRIRRRKNLFDLAGKISMDEGYDHKESRVMKHGAD